MTAKSRTAHIKNNLIFNVIKYLTQILLQFILRTILIYKLGSEYLGLNGLFSNIFACLNLAELGIGSAIVFSMYKPIAENDIEKVKALQNLYKRFYLIIFIVILVLGAGITPFIDLFINGGVTVDINIYLLYLMYLVNTLCGYLFAHKRSLIFAYQRNDIENKIRVICLVAMSLIQIAVLVIFSNYYLYYITQILFTIIESIIICISANKLFPEVNGKSQPIDKDTKKEITKNVTALSMHKIGGTVVFSTDNILISTFFGVVILGIYSNYHLILSAILSVFLIINNAMIASAGNLVASCDKEYVYSKFKTINFIFTYLSGFSAICLFSLFQPFMEFWTSGQELLLETSSMILIVISFYISRMRSGVLLLRDATGLYWQDRWKPIIESLVNLASSIILAKLIGINGIFLGTIISSLAAPVWVEPYVLYKHYFKKSLWQYFKRFIIDSLIMVVGAVICYFVCSFIPDGGILWLILKFAVCIILSNMILILAYLPTKEFKELWKIVKNVFKSIIRRNKGSI